MTKTLNIKTVAVVVGIALALSLGLGFAVQSAGAQSMSMSQLVDLFIQLGIIAPDKAAAAQAAVTTSTTSSGTTYTRDLTVGSTGADVTALQVMLGVSPATGYFGSITKAAVMQYQSVNGLPSTGYFGPLTRAKVNASVVVTTTTTTTTNTTTGGTMTGSGEGFLDDVQEVSSISSEEVGEDEEDVSVLGLEMTAEDADQQIDRVIVEIELDTESGSDNLDDYVTEASVWLDGELLGRMEVDDASYDRTDDQYTFRFTGLDGVIDEGDTAELVVAVSGVSNLDSTDLSDWNVTIPTNGIRAVSPNGTDDFYGAGETETFTVESFASANSVELKVSTDSSSPDSMSVEVDSENDTDGVELLVFKLKAEGSDITINDLPVLLTVTGAGYVEAVANSLVLEIDGEEFSESIASSTVNAAFATTTFNDLDLTIEEGDTVTVVVKADINDLNNSGVAGSDFDAGDTIKATLNAGMVDAIDAEDQSGEDLAIADLTGTATGEAIAFFADGLSIKFVSATEVVSDTAAAETNDRGTYTIKFEATAFGSDIYVDEDTASSTGAAGVSWAVTGATAFTGLGSSNLTSTADHETDSFLIEDGATETFTLTVTLINTAGTQGYYGVNVTEIGTAATDATATTFSTAGLEDLETDEVSLET